MPFLINPKTKKRKYQAADKKDVKNEKIKKKDLTKKRKHLKKDEDIDSDSNIDSGNEEADQREKLYSSEEDDDETPQQKRLRLAKEYLSQLEDEEADKADDEEAIKEAVSSRLQHDISEQAGKLIKEIADSCICPQSQDVASYRGHKHSVTALVISPDDKFVFTASKDCNICKWDLQKGLKVKTIKGGRKGTEDVHIGHTDHILCLAISSDGKFLAAGDMNKFVKLWNPEDCSFIHKFRGHRGPVTGVSFRSGSHTLYSCSTDKAVKIWSVDDLAYVETLYGHSAPITSIDTLSRERAITSGGSDTSIHIWKIPEDSQLVFNGHEGSIECVALINEGNFFSGSDDSSLCVWSVLKKKPIVIHKHAHGVATGHRSEDWISAVAALKYSDLVASGSKDGFVRLWKCEQGFKGGFKALTLLFEVPVQGFVNSLYFSKNGDFLVAGVGQEHRLGRWWRVKEARNGWVKIPLRNSSEEKLKPEEESSSVHINGVSESSEHDASVVSDSEVSQDSGEGAEAEEEEDNSSDNDKVVADDDTKEEDNDDVESEDDDEDDGESEEEDEDDDGDDDSDSENAEGDDGKDSFFLNSKKEDEESD